MQGNMLDYLRLIWFDLGQGPFLNQTNNQPNKMPKTPQSAKTETPLLTRNLTIGKEAIKNEEERLIEVSFSSETPVKRGGGFSEEWIETLGHKNTETDLTRINNKAPVLYNHDCFDKESRIGVVERAWLEDGRGKALLRISKRNEVEGIWQDIQDGILCNVSVGYRINTKELTTRNDAGISEYRVTSWTPMEISLVDIPADFSVGVGRTSSELTMDNGQLTMFESSFRRQLIFINLKLKIQNNCQRS
jgi:phage head maturation protease